MRNTCIYILLSAVLCFPLSVVGQDSTSRLVTIDNIFLTGNTKTKDKILLREISVKIGEAYDFDALQKILDSDRNKIYNTKLFNEVEVGVLEIDFDKVDIVIRVTERWYLFPIPLIDIIEFCVRIS